MRLLLPLCLIAIVLAPSCSRIGGTGIELDSSFKGFVPTGTKALIGVRVDRLKSSEFFKRHQSQFNLPQISSMSQSIGLDPVRDVSDIVIAWDGKQILTMAHGSFKSADVQQKLSTQTVPQQVYKNLVFFGDQKESVAFLPKSIALAGPADELKRSIDESAAGAGGVPDALQTRMHAVLANAQIWGASDGVLPLANIPLGSDAKSALSNLVDYVNGTNLGIAFDSGAHLKLDISCISPEGAQRVNDALRGLIGFARLSTRDNQVDMLRLWDAIHVEKTERAVVLHADLPADLAEKLSSQLAEMSKFSH